MFKLVSLAMTSLICMALAGFGPEPPEPPAPPQAKAKRPGDPKKKPGPPPKKEAGPEGDLRRAYELLVRLRAERDPAGRSDGRTREWLNQAADLYKQGARAFEDGDDRLAHEYGASAHDLARAVDHVRKAALVDRDDPGLPPPPAAKPGPGRDRLREDLNRVFDRIGRISDQGVDRESRRLFDGARELYNAARRDAQAGRAERAGELARAADALSHAVEHLGHAADGPPDERALPPVGPRRPRGEVGDELPPPID